MDEGAEQDKQPEQAPADGAKSGGEEQGAGDAQPQSEAGGQPSGEAAAMDAEPPLAVPQHQLPPTNKMQKRKVAMFLAYVGHGYLGMQRNPGVKTIEEDLFQAGAAHAVHKAGGISDANADKDGFMKARGGWIHWMRAARTDKGVSAVGQVVSFKMILEPPGMVERINSHLPPQIRVFGYSRATNGFDSRKHCDKRRRGGGGGAGAGAGAATTATSRVLACWLMAYEYILPEWAFDPARCQPRSQQQQQQWIEERRQDKATARASAGDAAAAGDAVPSGDATADSDAAGPAAGGEPPLLSPAAAEAEVAAAAAEAAEAAEVVLDEEMVGGGGGDDDATADPAALAAAEAEDEAAQPAVGANAQSQQQEGEQQPGGTGDAVYGVAAATAEGDGKEQQPFALDVERLNYILKQARAGLAWCGGYEGTHNFHNFTVRKPASAPDAKRYIISFKCGGVFEIGSERWVRLVVVGQSFMLHQIRKLVGMAVAVARGVATLDALKLAMKTSVGLNVPMAPELGLFLDQCYYEAYNKQQWGHQNERLSLDDYRAAVDAFKAEQLYPHIAARDAEEGINAGWLRSLNEAAYRFGDWPAQVAAVRRGGGRSAPPPKGSGAAATVGSFERYGQKRKGPAGGGRGGGRDGGKRGRGPGAADMLRPVATAAPSTVKTKELAQADAALKSLVNAIADTLAKGNKVEITGFGSFYARKLFARNGRNPHTGEAMQIPESVTAAFSAGMSLKATVKAGHGYK
eukprot:scaffold9.g3093.t1